MPPSNSLSSIFFTLLLLWKEANSGRIEPPDPQCANVMLFGRGGYNQLSRDFGVFKVAMLMFSPYWCSGICLHRVWLDVLVRCGTVQRRRIGDRPLLIERIVIAC